MGKRLWEELMGKSLWSIVCEQKLVGKNLWARVCGQELFWQELVVMTGMLNMEHSNVWKSAAG